MTPKQYLSKLLYLDEQINTNLEILVRLRERAESIPAFSASDKVQTSTRTDFTDVINKMVDLEEKLNIQIDHYVDTKNQMLQEINSLDNSLYSLILIKKYVQYKNLVKISFELEYSADWMKHLHGHALQAFKKKFPEKFK